MQVELIKTNIEQKPLLANLIELYTYDFTKFNNFDIGDDGFYGYKYLSLYWTEQNRFPYIVYVNNKIAGFVLVQQGSPISTDKKIWDIAEFFIMQRYKRQGIGTTATYKLWQQFQGNWQVRVLTNNQIACSFWARAIENFTSAAPVSTQKLIKGEEWIIYSFESK